MQEQNKIVARIVENLISLDEIYISVNSFKNGAQVLFFGTVRNHNDGKAVHGVSYFAHKSLAERAFIDICNEALEKWGQETNIAILHRIGRLGVGQISIAIAVGSPHRREAYQVSRYLIEQLKIRAPIWKKEHYESGESEWLQGHALCAHSA